MPDAEKRRRTLSLPFVIIPTYGVIIDYSTIGLARFGDSDQFETIRNGSLRHTKDALIAGGPRAQPPDVRDFILPKGELCAT
jgi:hypothetical protein